VAVIVGNGNVKHDGAAHVVALKYWSSQQLDALSGMVAREFSSWMQAWAISDNSDPKKEAWCANIGAGNMSVIDLDCWYPLHQENARSSERAWLCLASAAADAIGAKSPPSWLLRRALFDDAGKADVFSLSQAKTDIAGEIADAAWRDLIARMRNLLKMPEVSALAISAAAIPADDCKRWNGAVQIELPWCDAIMFMHLNSVCVEAIAPARAPAPSVPAHEPFVQLMHALGNQVLSVSAEMSSIDISIGDLQSLRVNDVVLFNHRLDEPVSIRIKEGGNFAHGFLGKSRGNWAVELEAGTMKNSDLSL
jgi:hypothetical protein